MYNALHGESHADASDGKPEEVKANRRNRVTISLSDRSMKAFREIKALTDADTDSEVFRNALRLYLGLLRAHKEGKVLFVRDEREGIVSPVELFLPPT